MKRYFKKESILYSSNQGQYMVKVKRLAGGKKYLQGLQVHLVEREFLYRLESVLDVQNRTKCKKLMLWKKP